MKKSIVLFALLLTFAIACKKNDSNSSNSSNDSYVTFNNGEGKEIRYTIPEINASYGDDYPSGITFSFHAGSVGPGKYYLSIVAGKSGSDKLGDYNIKPNVSLYYEYSDQGNNLNYHIDNYGYKITLTKAEQNLAEGTFTMNVINPFKTKTITGSFKIKIWKQVNQGVVR